MRELIRLAVFMVCVSAALGGQVQGQRVSSDTRRGDAMIADYFAAETRRLADGCLTDVDSLEAWEKQRPILRRQLLEMLGLDPPPEKTDLQPETTGETRHERFVVRQVHFQSRPGLYVTGNLYVPNDVAEPLPAVLYVCGHGQVKQDGVSYGNKTYYRRHGAWLARHGFVCLTIDTLQLGEIEGLHHGTYRENMWWWLNRGYTPAGVEAWNGIRGIDYLQSLPFVDPQRIGVTGRSGGGAYTWWIAAIDDRVKCAVPVAGITDLENHVVDGCVEGHCDCMYMVNTYRWDYPLIAALVAPRPLLISNSDRDPIFPLDGVYRTHQKVKQIYALYGAEDRLGLNITAGGHEDTQELRIHAFRWLNRHLRDDASLIEEPAEEFFEPADLKVFDALPEEQRNTTIHETFVAEADPPVPASGDAWRLQAARWQAILDEKVFAGWPAAPDALSVEEVSCRAAGGIIYRTLEFTSQGPFRLPIVVAQRSPPSQPTAVELHVLDDSVWLRLQARMSSAEDDVFSLAVRNEAGLVLAFLPPRGVGPTRWDATPKKQIQHQRRFYLLGQTLDGQRVYDVRRAIQALRQHAEFSSLPVRLSGQGAMAGVALYAALYEPDIATLDLIDLPSSHRQGPFLLNATRFFDLPQVVAMAAEKMPVVLHHADRESWSYAIEVGRLLDRDVGFQ